MGEGPKDRPADLARHLQHRITTRCGRGDIVGRKGGAGTSLRAVGSVHVFPYAVDRDVLRAAGTAPRPLHHRFATGRGQALIRKGLAAARGKHVPVTPGADRQGRGNGGQ